MESLPTLDALLPEWHFALGDLFPLAWPFLSPSPRQAETYPCAKIPACGCRHRVVYYSLEHIEGHCECADAGCEPIPLRASDLVFHQIDINRLAGAIQPMMGLDPAPAAPALAHRTWQIGSLGRHRAPVFFSSPIEMGDFMLGLEALFSTVQDPFILMTPTNRLGTGMVQSTLRRQGCVHISLADTLTVIPGGKFKLNKEIEPLLEPIRWRHASQLALEKSITRIDRTLQALATNSTPLQKPPRDEQQDCDPDDSARKLFALVKQLESESSWRKAPILQVFRLYCMEALTAREIARRCRCAKSLVVLRLRQLRDKLGCDPAALRAYSGQFERIADSLRDPRARRISVKSAIEDDFDEEY